jgi:hypothetical protein
VTRAEGIQGLRKLKRKSDDLRRGKEAARGLLNEFR